MKKAKIFIAGAGGMLGEGFYSVINDSFSAKYTDINLTSDRIELLDFKF